MRPYIDTSQILESREIGDHTCEVVATAKGEYDAATGELRLELDSFLRRVNTRGRDDESRPRWLPKPDRMTDHVPPGDASEEVKEVFHKWAAKVRRSIPDTNLWEETKASPPATATTPA